MSLARLISTTKVLMLQCGSPRKELSPQRLLHEGGDVTVVRPPCIVSDIPATALMTTLGKRPMVLGHHFSVHGNDRTISRSLMMIGLRARKRKQICDHANGVWHHLTPTSCFFSYATSSTAVVTFNLAFMTVRSARHLNEILLPVVRKRVSQSTQRNHWTFL